MTSQNPCILHSRVLCAEREQLNRYRYEFIRCRSLNFTEIFEEMVDERLLEKERWVQE